ncbi:MAG: hypothetical protein R2702_06540 [Acidimicrobiales bacterium]
MAVVPYGPLAEDPDLYREFCEGVIDYWRPVGPSEEQLAQAIADLQWRDARVPLYEASLLANTGRALEWEEGLADREGHELEVAAACRRWLTSKLRRI